MRWNIRLPNRWEHLAADLRSQIEQWLAALGGRLVRTYRLLPFITVELPATVHEAEVRLMPGALDVEPDQFCVGCYDPNLSWATIQVHAPQVHTTTRGQGIVVAVLDTGLSMAHPDLAGVQVLYQESFVDGETPADGNGHGTAVTSLIAGQGQRLLGIAPDVGILNLKVLSNAGSGTFSAIAAALERAVALGAHVINMSLGSQETSQLVDQALLAAAQSGAVAVAPVGNEGLSTILFPASSRYTIAVGATTGDLTIPSWSNSGPWPDCADVVAPGDGVYVASTLGGQYLPVAGTSFSCAIVSGIIALARAYDATLHGLLGEGMDPKYGPQPLPLAEVRQRLSLYAVDLGQPPERQGYGFLLADSLVFQATGTKLLPVTTAQGDWVPVAVVGLALWALSQGKGHKGRSGRR